MDEVISALKSRNINAYFVSDKESAKSKALDIIEKGKPISFGGSITLNQIGLIEELKSGEYNLIDRDLCDSNKFMKQWVMKNSNSGGTYISGANAITKDGKIVNMDGWGNRVNAINYGPEKIIIITGKNKIVNDLNEAVERIEMIAAPKNTKRLGKKTPCVDSGKCVDCRSSERICNILSVVQFQNDSSRMHIILVDEELGY